MNKENVAKLRAQLEKEPENDKLWFDLGQEYFELDWQDAVNCFSRAININPFNALYYFNRGRKKLSQDKFAEALAEFTIATRIDAKDNMQWHYLGVAWFYLEDFENAVVSFRKSIDLQLRYGGDLIPPSVDWSWMAYMKMGKRAEAGKILEIVTEDTPIADTDKDYKTRVQLYQGRIAPEKFYAELNPDDDLQRMAEVYGLANYYYYVENDKERNLELLEEVLAYTNWHHSFAYKSTLLEIGARKAALGR